MLVHVGAESGRALFIVYAPPFPPPQPYGHGMVWDGPFRMPPGKYQQWQVLWFSYHCAPHGSLHTNTPFPADVQNGAP
jgi:hypothetical protein